MAQAEVLRPFSQPGPWRHTVVARLAPTLGSTIPQSRTLAFAEFEIQIQMHRCAVLKLRKTPQNSGKRHRWRFDSSRTVALRGRQLLRASPGS